MNAKQYEKYKAAVEHNLKGLEFVSTGACPGCEECGLDGKTCSYCDGDGGDPENEDKDCPKCNGEGLIPPTEHDIELASEPSFSWSSCDSCGSSLGGDRHPAHGVDKDKHTIHFEVCVDCLTYLNYGQLDDMAMMEIEASKQP